MLGASTDNIRALEFKYIEVDLQQGASPERWIGELTSFLANANAEAALRARAGLRLLIAADLLLDGPLAQSASFILRSVPLTTPEHIALRRRAALVYETVFGDLDRAHEIVSTLLLDFPDPALAQSTIMARHDVGYSLSRMGHYDRAKPILVANYRFMLTHHVSSEAVYSLLLLAENALSQGALSEAEDWLIDAERMIATDESRTHASLVGLYSARASLALMTGRLADAERLIAEVRDRQPIVRTPRFFGLSSALTIRILAARGVSLTSHPLVEELRDLYARAGHLGGQDSIVEALWLAERAVGEADRATLLLEEYLFSRRREMTRPEWSLCSATARERVWHCYGDSSQSRREDRRHLSGTLTC
jgi:hypothetical protein